MNYPELTEEEILKDKIRQKKLEINQQTEKKILNDIGTRDKQTEATRRAIQLTRKEVAKSITQVEIKELDYLEAKNLELDLILKKGRDLKAALEIKENE